MSPFPVNPEVSEPLSLLGRCWVLVQNSLGFLLIPEPRVPFPLPETPCLLPCDPSWASGAVDLGVDLARDLPQCCGVLGRPLHSSRLGVPTRVLNGVPSLSAEQLSNW